MDSAAAQAGELGPFLRSRRARLVPDEVGIASYGARRVPGLRREELAQLAGVSSAYYTRLEQGQSTNASYGVVEAIAGALGLDADERAHLHDLAAPPRAPRRPSAEPDEARSGTVRLLDAMSRIPAVALGLRTEVLAWNRLGHALLAGHCDPGAPLSGERPNLTRMLFLDLHTRDLYDRWDEEGERAVASLRLVAGRHADDPELIGLVGELSLKSEPFARLWSDRPVVSCTSGTKHFRHPEVGPMELAFEVMHLPDDVGQRVMTYTAESGSASEAALQLLR